MTSTQILTAEPLGTLERRVPAQLMKAPATDERPDDSKNDVSDEPVPEAFHDKGGKRSSNKADNDPSENVHVRR